MIRRDAGEHWLLISQVEHAYLAADLASAWGNAHMTPLPRSEHLVPAVRDHDEGWRAWEQSPQVDAQGRPREFLEMPMTEATDIWSRSIDFSYRREREAAALLDQFQQFLATRGKQLSSDRAAITIAALLMRDAFDAERLLDQLAGPGGRTPSLTTVRRTLNWLEGVGFLRRESQPRRHIYTVADKRLGPSPLAGLWVSRHFTFLAERARDSRHAADKETAALDAFLEMQSELQSDWLEAAAACEGDESPEDIAETGFRWLQFFDRLSLWLCCAPAANTETMTRPDGGAIHFTPLPSEEIAVEPYPFTTDSLVVSVTARRIPIARYDNASLPEIYRKAPLEHLRWTFVRW